MGKLHNINIDDEFCIDDIKKVLSQLSKHDITTLKELKIVNRELSEKMVNLCISMFLYRKRCNKEYNSLGVSKLKRIKLQEDGLIDENTYIQLLSFFSDYLHYFHQLVAECFVSASRAENCDSQIFLAKYYTYYFKKELSLYLVKSGNQYYVINGDRYDIELGDYLSQFSEEIVPDALKPDENIYQANERTEIEAKLSILFKRINAKNKKDNKFVYGAISFLDFLGWKGLWLQNNTEPLDQVSDLIEENRKYLSAITKDVFHDEILRDISSLISISDTIAIFTPKICNISNQDLLSIHSKITKNFIESSCKAGYAIRGAISFGKYCIKDNIMIGPGIDECAGWHEQCDWIGVHLTPSAQFIISDSALPQGVIKYSKIPTKNKIKLKYCVDWQISKEEFDSLVRKTESILPEIAAKYLNTYKFLEERRKEEQNGKK